MMLRRFLASEEGVTAIEYALLASLIAVAILGAVLAVSDSVTGTFETIAACVSNPGSC